MFALMQKWNPKCLGLKSQFWFETNNVVNMLRWNHWWNSQWWEGTVETSQFEVGFHFGTKQWYNQTIYCLIQNVDWAVHFSNVYNYYLHNVISLHLTHCKQLTSHQFTTNTIYNSALSLNHRSPKPLRSGSDPPVRRPWNIPRPKLWPEAMRPKSPRPPVSGEPLVLNEWSWGVNEFIVLYVFVVFRWRITF